MNFRRIFLKIERVPVLRSMNAEASNFQIKLHFIVALRNCYFIAKIGTLLLLPSAFNQGDLFKTKQNSKIQQLVIQKSVVFYTLKF